MRYYSLTKVPGAPQPALGTIYVLDYDEWLREAKTKSKLSEDAILNRAVNGQMIVTPRVNFFTSQCPMPHGGYCL